MRLTLAPLNQSQMVFQIMYDSWDSAGGFFATRELAQAVMDEMVANGLGFDTLHIAEREVYTNAAEYIQAHWDGCSSFKQFVAYRDSNYTVKPAA